MKKQKQFITLLLMLCMAMVSFTSCNDDDDNNKALTAEEVQACFNTVKGSYNGKLVYKNASTTNSSDVTDTLDCSWSITTDSTLTINNFPVKLLANNVTDSTLKAAIQQLPAQSITCGTYYVNTNPVEFLVNPYTLTYNLNYGGEAHKVQIAFYIGNTFSFGAYTPANSTLTMQIIEGGIYIDGTLTKYLSHATWFDFYGTK